MKINGKTLRFRGNIDLEAARLYFDLVKGGRCKLKFIEFSDVWRIHPSGLLPILADVLSRGERLIVKCYNNPWVARFLLLHGYSALITTGAAGWQSTRFRGVNQFLVDGEDHQQYVNLILTDMLRRRACGPDVLAALQWATVELIGNVFDHAQSSTGVLVHYLSQQLNGEQRFILTVADSGMGLSKSLGARYPEIKTDAEAISLAIQRGITSKRDNYGWGLFGSTSIIRAAHGRFTLWSGSSVLRISEDGTSKYSEAPDYPGLIVEWMLPVCAVFDMGEVLQRDRDNVFVYIVDERYGASADAVTMRLAAEAKYLSNRAIARKLRNTLLNLIETCRVKCCIVDFANTTTVSSSFADEFLGKTAVLFGDKFAQRVRVKNASEVNRAILEVAIAERVRREREADTPLRIRRQ